MKNDNIQTCKGMLDLYYVMHEKPLIKKGLLYNLNKIKNVNDNILS